MSKVLLINGSPHARGCTATALGVVADVLEQNGIETEIIHVGHKGIRGCIGCGKCRELGKCVFDKDNFSNPRRFCLILFICCLHLADAVQGIQRAGIANEGEV
ncbi:MAG: flavodoxin family protein [Prevotella sp.]|nr:flavodoxin family protein [Prevotella sp.]